jgi:2-methylcitrate dehydratase PrpD
MSGTITQRLADHVVGLRFEDIPDHIVERAKEHLVHHVGLAFRSVESGEAHAAIELARGLSGGSGDFSLVGSPHRAALFDAVFANSFLMGYQGLDDVVLPCGVHPGVIVIPTALATAEATHASGRDLLTSIVVGYDVMAKLCAGVWTWGLDVPRRPNNVFGPFGGAAAAARLLGLSREQTVHALGHAGQAGMGIVEGVDHLWTMHALLARNGLMAAKLAEAGMPASPEIIEGTNGVYRSMTGQGVPRELDAEFAGLGHTFEIGGAVTKRIGASAINILPIELMQGLVAAHGLTAERVAQIDVELPVEREPREAVWEKAMLDPRGTPTGRSGSLRFRLAMIVVDALTDPARYRVPPDHALNTMLGRIRLRYSPGHALRFVRIEVTTTAGHRHVAEGDEHTYPPLDWGDWLSTGGELLGEARLARAIELLRDLQDVADVRDLLACLAREAPAGIRG